MLVIFEVLCIFVVSVTWSSSEVEISGCSFKSGEYTYNIQLSNVNTKTCKEPAGPVRELIEQKTPVRSISIDTQNDVATKVDSIEKNFETIKERHEERLKELENSVRELLGLDKRTYKPKKSEVNSTSAPYIFEGTLLTRLQREFNELREKLRRKSEKLLRTELELNDTKKAAKTSQVNLMDVNQKLLDAENRISDLRRERAVLKNELRDSEQQYSDMASQMNESASKMKSMENQMTGLVSLENSRSQDLQLCRGLLNHSDVDMNKAKNRYAELRRRHDVVKHQLRIRERELINSYSAKTATFCGFEDPYACGFTQETESDKFNWTRVKGKTPSGNTGPSKDHTCETNTGHFMYIEASTKAPGDKAIMYSPLYRGMVRQCVGFHYHMYGRHVGTLNVYAKARGYQINSAWGAFGNQGDVWIIARLAIPKELARAGYRIAFEGVTEKGYQGDIAVDDVSVEDGPCPVDSNAVEVIIKAENPELVEEEDKLFRKARKRKHGKNGKNGKNENGDGEKTPRHGKKKHRAGRVRRRKSKP